MSLYSLIRQYVVRKLPQFNLYRIGVASMSDPEYLSAIGLAYDSFIDVQLASGQEIWLKVSSPSNCPLQVIRRSVQPQLAGCAYEVYTGSSGYSVNSTLTMRRKNPDSGRAALGSIQVISTPTTVGTKVDVPIYIGEGSSNPASRLGGTNSNEEGAQRYSAGGGFFARIVNLSGASNRIVTKLTVAEIDVDYIKMP